MSYKTELDILVANKNLVRIRATADNASQRGALTHLAKLMPVAESDYEKLGNYLKRRKKTINRLILASPATGSEQIYLQQIIADTRIPTLFISISKTKLANNYPSQRQVSIHPLRLAQDLKAIVYP